MAIKKFGFISDVAETYQLSIRKESFLIDLKPVPMPDFLKSEMDFMLKNYPYSVSEAAIRETLLFPILKEVWKRYDENLMLWANKSIKFSKDLGGVPDYMVAKQSHLGKTVFGKPLLAVVEAQKDDFEGGWAQCLLEMYTIQKINGKPDMPILGIVTNGDNWEFGKLVQTLFTKNTQAYSISNMDVLFSVLIAFFERCKENATTL